MMKAITAVQSELSLFSPAQEGVLETCKELGIAFVAYSSLGRGMLNGTIKSADDIPKRDFRRSLPRFQGANFAKNLELVDGVGRIAAKKGCTSGQLALAWTMNQGDHIFPIPGDFCDALSGVL
jgi:aryl-alcohol dehydrogenase-like predicted oxidoreductase